MNDSLQLSREGAPLDGFIAFSFAAQYQNLADTGAAFLHPHEQRYWLEAKSTARQASFLLGRHAAKQALAGSLPGESGAQIEIAWGVFGQPLVRCGAKAPPEISIAHTREAAVAVACPAGHPIGVDLEQSALPKALPAADVCAPGEQALLARFARSRPEDLILLWTIKEALAKALRCGLMTPPAVLQIASLAGSEAGTCVAQFKNFPQYQAFAWVLGSHVLAIALPRRTSLEFQPGAGLRRQFQLAQKSGASP